MLAVFVHVEERSLLGHGSAVFARGVLEGLFALLLNIVGVAVNRDAFDRERPLAVHVRVGVIVVRADEVDLHVRAVVDRHADNVAVATRADIDNLRSLMIDSVSLLSVAKSLRAVVMALS